MTEIASRELRNHSRAVLDRVEGGEAVVITVNGRPVARLEPVGRRARWMGRDEFVGTVMAHQADSGLAHDIAALGQETTDDLSFS